MAKRIDTCRPDMAAGSHWVNYVNTRVLKDVKSKGIAMTADYTIQSGEMSAVDFFNAFKESGWWWPEGWSGILRKNRNPQHKRAQCLQREMEPGKWMHLVVYPEQTQVQRTLLGIKLGTKTVDDWSKPLRKSSELHCERYWLQPSSAAHWVDFVREQAELAWQRIKQLIAR
jgi:hypothetical protein